MFSLVYGTFRSTCLSPRVAAANDLRVKDFSAFLFIAFSVKRRARTRVRALGATSLLDKIFQDATTYFLMIFSSHLVLLFFLFLAPVSYFLNGLFPSAYDELHVGIESAPSCRVSHHPLTWKSAQI